MGSLSCGFNYPWAYNQDGAQIGPRAWVDAATWAAENAAEARGDLAATALPPIFDHLARNLDNLKRMGFGVVRWFLLGNGMVYGPAPTFVASIYGDPSGVFTPPSTLDKRFRRDFVALLDAFKNAGIKLLPSLINYEFAGPLGGGPNGTAAGGRMDVLNDPTKRKTFLDTVLGELLDASKPYADQIFAWEVINEPFWLTTGFGPLSSRPWIHRSPEVSEQNMVDFLKDAVERIEKAGFASTVGHRFLSDFDTFPTGTMRQFHYYAKTYTFKAVVGIFYDVELVHFGDPATIPPFSQTRAIIGEMGGSATQSNRWPELPVATQSPNDRLKLLESKGYQTVLLWGDMPPDDPQSTAHDAIKLLAPARESIVQYAHGVLPPPSE